MSGQMIKKSPKQALKDNAEEVRSWPAYLRVYSSEYFKWKERVEKNAHMYKAL